MLISYLMVRDWYEEDSAVTVEPKGQLYALKQDRIPLRRDDAKLLP